MSFTYLCGEYDRLSKEDEKKNKQDESNSIANQHLIIESYAKHNNLKIVERYVDDGYSGGNYDRPEFQRMLEDIESGRINCVITKDLSRLGRELYKTGTFIEQYFLEKGVRYIAINDGYDSDIGDSMLGLRLGVNDLFIRDTSRKVKDALRAKQERGDYIGSFPQYGFMKDPKNKSKLIKDPITAPIVYQWGVDILNGSGTTKIAQEMTEKCIPIPCVYKNEPRAKKITDNDGKGIWRPQTILNILRSELNVGNMVQNICNKISFQSKKHRAVPQEKWIVVENTHEGIFTREMFDRIQVELDKKKKYRARNEDDFLLKGLLKCKECEHGISILVKKCKKQNSHYTQCNYYTKNSVYGYCSPHRLNYNFLESDILETIKEMGKEFIKQYENGNLVKICEEFLNSEVTDKQKELTKISDEIVKIDDIKKKLYSDRLEDIITVAEYKELTEKYKETLDNLKLKEKNLINEIKEIEQTSSKISLEECKKIVDQYIGLKNPNKEILNQIIDKVEIDGNKVIDVHFKIKTLNLVRV